MERSTVVLSHSGLHAEIQQDRFVEGAIQLVVDGTPQSHVNLDNPSDLFFEYVRRIGNVIDALAIPGERLSALHLGAGALTLPRYIEATRPGSSQQVIELEPELVDLVRAHAPLPKRAQIRIRYGDARDRAAKLPTGMLNSTDLVIADLFSGAQTPARVTSVEFFSLLKPLLSPHGMLVANVTDGPPLRFARAQAATLEHVFGHVAIFAEPQVLKGKRFGNMIMVAAAHSLERAWADRVLAGGPHPAAVILGDELRRFVAQTPPTFDTTATDSPKPGKRIFQAR